MDPTGSQHRGEYGWSEDSDRTGYDSVPMKGFKGDWWRLNETALLRELVAANIGAIQVWIRVLSREGEKKKAIEESINMKGLSDKKVLWALEADRSSSFFHTAIDPQPNESFNDWSLCLSLYHFILSPARICISICHHVRLPSWLWSMTEEWWSAPTLGQQLGENNVFVAACKLVALPNRATWADWVHRSLWNTDHVNIEYMVVYLNELIVNESRGLLDLCTVVLKCPIDSL